MGQLDALGTALRSRDVNDDGERLAVASPAAASKAPGSAASQRARVGEIGQGRRPGRKAAGGVEGRELPE